MPLSDVLELKLNLLRYVRLSALTMNCQILTYQYVYNSVTCYYQEEKAIKEGFYSMVFEI